MTSVAILDHQLLVPVRGWKQTLRMYSQSGSQRSHDLAHRYSSLVELGLRVHHRHVIRVGLWGRVRNPQVGSIATHVLFGFRNSDIVHVRSEWSTEQEAPGTGTLSTLEFPASVLWKYLLVNIVRAPEHLAPKICLVCTY